MDSLAKEYYLQLRKKYHPAKLTTVFVLESPPASGKYFYDETGSIGEPLFAAMMKLLKVNPGNKKRGLEIFANLGCLIVDATYTPVNKLIGKARDNVVINNYENLFNDLKQLGDPGIINFILVKANVCRLLESRLLSDGFNVKNNGVIIPFPSTGQQTNFHKKMSKIFQTSYLNL